MGEAVSENIKSETNEKLWDKDFFLKSGIIAYFFLVVFLFNCRIWIVDHFRATNYQRENGNFFEMIQAHFSIEEKAKIDSATVRENVTKNMFTFLLVVSPLIILIGWFFISKMSASQNDEPKRKLWDKKFVLRLTIIVYFFIVLVSLKCPIWHCEYHGFFGCAAFTTDDFFEMLRCLNSAENNKYAPGGLFGVRLTNTIQFLLVVSPLLSMLCVYYKKQTTGTLLLDAEIK